MTLDRHNTISASDKIYRYDMWTTFDGLPACVRRAHHEAVVNWDPVEDLEYLEILLDRGHQPAEAALIVAKSTRAADQQEIMQFADRYRQQHGSLTAHVLAEATPQFYERRR